MEEKEACELPWGPLITPHIVEKDQLVHES
jgi:hypothetical protein